MAVAVVVAAVAVAVAAAAVFVPKEPPLDTPVPDVVCEPYNLYEDRLFTVLRLFSESLYLRTK